MAIEIRLTGEHAVAYMELARRGLFESVPEVDPDVPMLDGNKFPGDDRKSVTTITSYSDYPGVPPTVIEVDPATLFAQAQTEALVVPPAPPVPTIAVTAAVPVPPTTIAQSPVAPPAPPVTIIPIPPSLDKSGLPWDARIHSGSKAITKEGMWRTKRNVDDALLATVTAELRSLMNIPAPAPVVAMTASQAMPVLPVIPNVPTFPAVPKVTVALPDASSVAGNIPVPPAPPVAADTGAAASSGAVPPVPAAPPVPVPPPASAVVPSPATTATTASPSSGAMTFHQFVSAITSRKAAGTLTQDQINEALASMGVPKIPLVAARPDLIPSLAMLLGIE